MVSFTEILQTKTFSLSVNKVCWNIVSCFLYKQAQDAVPLALCYMVRSQGVLRAVEKCSSLRKKAVPLARPAKRTLPPRSRSDTRRLGKLASTRPTCLDLGLAPSAPSHRKASQPPPREPQGLHTRLRV